VFKNRKLIFVILLFVVLLSFFGFMRSRYTIPILMYHSVAPQAEKGYRLKVTPDVFAKQMRFLREHGYNIVTLEEAADLLRKHKRIPPMTVVVTFDDGYKDNYIYAYPVLKQYKIPATIFLIANEVQRPQGDKLSWSDIEIMQAGGLIAFGSHTLNHAWLPEVTSDNILKNEISESKKYLEDKLGVKVDTFCYPGGRLNAKIRQMVIDAGYKVAVSTNKGRARANDLFALNRVRISQNDSNQLIFWFKASGYYNAFRKDKNAY